MNNLQLPKISIEDLEANMLQLPQAECPVFNKFDKGIYIRELHMPAGIIAIGHHQNYRQINVFVKGKVAMMNEDGSTKILTAPMTFVGEPGRKVGYIIEDTIWQNIYITDETDVEVLEATYFTKSDTFLLSAAHRFALESVNKQVDRDDYQEVVKSLEYTEEYSKEDQMPMPQGNYKVRIDISPIHGQGVFATANIEPGELIGPTKIGVYRTPLDRFINHSATPNARIEQREDKVYLIATEKIIGIVGGFSGQELTIDYRNTRKLVGV